MSRKGQMDISLPISGTLIESKENIDIRGVNLDSKLNFNDHVKSICARASYQINALKRIVKFLTLIVG